MDKNHVLTQPKTLVEAELKNAGFDPDQIKVPKRVFLLFDSIYEEMRRRDMGEYKYPVGGKLYVFPSNPDVGFVKGQMCSPGIATQAEDLFAAGVKELIQIGFAGGIQEGIGVGDIILSDGAFHDTAVAKLYGFDEEYLKTTKELTDPIHALFMQHSIPVKRGTQWTTDAGYHETWGQILGYREKGALCVEMEGAGLFTIAKYRSCAAAAIYIISDTLDETGWRLGWQEDTIAESVKKIIDYIIPSV